MSYRTAYLQRTVHIGAVLLVTLLGACSDPNSPQARLDRVEDACGLLPEDTVRELLNSEPAAPHRRHVTANEKGRAAVLHCTIPSSDKEAYRSVSLLLRRAAKGEAAEGAMDRHLASLRTELEGSAQPEILTGFGESAFWNPVLDQLTVFIGADMLIFSVDDDSLPEDRKEKVKLLASRTLNALIPPAENSAR